MALAEKLRKLRTEKGMTRKAAAQQTQMTVATYSSYEDGKRVPKRNPENYDKLAALFGCSVEYLKDDSIPVAPSADETAAPARRGRKAKALAEEPKKAIRIELQYNGTGIDMDALAAKAKSIDADVTALYVKPEENMVYYVAGENSGSFELFS